MDIKRTTISIMDDPEAATIPIQILFGTVTGNSEVLAEETAEKLNEMGLNTELSATENFNPDELYQMETLLLIISTDSGGVPPWMAEDFYKFLNEKNEADLQHLSFSVLALGDSYYPEFCQAGKDFDRMLGELGAHRIADRVDCDIHFWDDFEIWFEEVCSVLTENRKVLNCST